MRRKKNHKGFEHIGDVLPKVLKTYRCESDGNLAQVWHFWDHAVGEAIAANAQPAAFKGNILLVKVNSSVWLHHLQFLKANIIDKLNDALGEAVIKEIKFKIGSL